MASAVRRGKQIGGSLVGGVLLLIAALITLLVAPKIHRVSGTGEPIRGTRPGPVLIVPGYGGSTGSLEILAKALAADGRTVQIVQLPGDGRGDLRTQAKTLATAAARVLRVTGAASLDVVGYSAGGVVARLWAQDGGGAKEIRRLVMLGAPNHGTLLAGLARFLLPFDCPTACRQLAPGSSLLDELNGTSVSALGPTMVSVWTSDDRIVLPPDSARLDGALNLPVQQICATLSVSHEGLPTSRVVANIVRAEIGAAPARLLSQADCARLN